MTVTTVLAPRGNGFELLHGWPQFLAQDTIKA